MAEELTARELEVLRWIAKGLTNAQIAQELSISEYTVETHRKNLNHKLAANNTATLLMKAREKGFL